MDRISAVRKDRSESSFALLSCKDTAREQEMSVNQEVGSPYQTLNQPLPFNLGLSSSRTVRNKFLLFINDLVYGSLF